MIPSISSVRVSSFPVTSRSSSTEAKSLLPIPADADVGTQIAVLLLQAQRERRTDLRNEMRAEAANERNAQEQQLKDMEHKADAALFGGLVSSVGAMAGPISSLKVFSRIDATKSVVEGAAKAGESLLNHTAENFNIDATRNGQNAARAAERKQALRGDLDDAKAIANKAMQFVSEFQKQQAETTLSIWRR